jgi:pimeloyl-ACP methyl ester carboxylesterase
VARDPVAFARLQWETWSPHGWYDDAEFAATADSFRNPDWVPITLNAYRSRFLAGEARDPRYDRLAKRLADTETISVPTLMLQGAADFCDEPASSEGLDGYVTGGYRREVIGGAGHFPNTGGHARWLSPRSGESPGHARPMTGNRWQAAALPAGRDVSCGRCCTLRA